MDYLHSYTQKMLQEKSWETPANLQEMQKCLLAMLKMKKKEKLWHGNAISSNLFIFISHWLDKDWKHGPQHTCLVFYLVSPQIDIMKHSEILPTNLRNSLKVIFVYVISQCYITTKDYLEFSWSAQCTCSWSNLVTEMMWNYEQQPRFWHQW